MRTFSTGGFEANHCHLTLNSIEEPALGGVDDPTRAGVRAPHVMTAPKVFASNPHRDEIVHPHVFRLELELLNHPLHPEPRNWAFDPSAKHHRFEIVLKEIFYTIFVSKSIELDLIDLANLYVTADSTKPSTYANPTANESAPVPKVSPVGASDATRISLPVGAGTPTGVLHLRPHPLRTLRLLAEPHLCGRC